MGKRIVTMDAATPAQLRDYAALKYGLELTGRETSAMMRNKLKAVNDTATEFEVDDNLPADGNMAQTDKVNPVSGSTQGVDMSNEKVRINIHTSEASGGSDPVKVSVNGRAMIIPRGEVCAVPAPYVEVLENAKQSVPILDRDGKITGSRSVKAYPFERVA